MVTVYYNTEKCRSKDSERVLFASAHAGLYKNGIKKVKIESLETTQAIALSIAMELPTIWNTDIFVWFSNVFD